MDLKSYYVQNNYLNPWFAYSTGVVTIGTVEHLSVIGEFLKTDSALRHFIKAKRQGENDALNPLLFSVQVLENLSDN